MVWGVESHRGLDRGVPGHPSGQEHPQRHSLCQDYSLGCRSGWYSGTNSFHRTELFECETLWRGFLARLLAQELLWWVLLDNWHLRFKPDLTHLHQLFFGFSSSDTMAETLLICKKQAGEIFCRWISYWSKAYFGLSRLTLVITLWSFLNGIS